MFSMYRRCSMVSKRKQDLKNKLKELEDEGSSVFRYVKCIIEEGTCLVTDLEGERDTDIFLQRYPVVIKTLDGLVNKIVQLNCNIGLSISDDDVEEGARNDSCVAEQTFTKSAVHKYERLTPGSSIEFNAHDVGPMNEILQLNCDFGLRASGEVEGAQNEPCVTEQALLTESTVHSCEQLTSENSTPYSDAHIVIPIIHDDTFALETTHSPPSKNGLSSCPVEGEILDMCFQHGMSPYNFWLRYYASKSRNFLNETMLSRFHKKQLHPFEMHAVCIGTYVCAFDGNKCIRGKVLEISSKQPTEFMVLDVDGGRIQKFEQDSVFRLDEDLLEIPAQALNCRLSGDLGDSSLWNDQVTPLFNKVLTESALVVTICGKMEGNPPQFLVEIDCHNDRRRNSTIDLNKWIISIVFPKLEEMKNSKGDGILKSLFEYLDPVNMDRKNYTKEKLCLENIKKVSPHSTQISSSTLCGRVPCITGCNQSDNESQGDLTSVKHMEPSPQESHKSDPADLPVNMNIPMNSEVIELNPCPPQIVCDHSERNDGFSCINKGITGESVLCEAVRLSSVGQNCRAMLVHIEDPSEFYIHTICEDSVEIDNLQNRMTQYYGTNRVSFKSKEEAKYCIGLFCAAFYDTDEKWYRAKVIDWNLDNASDQVSIKYVDYGNVASVHFSMLQPLSSEFTKLPVCATKCSLAMIYPTTSTQDKISQSWSQEAAELFKCLVNMESVYSVILVESSDNSNCSLPVLLHDCKKDGCTINETMVDLGYAVSFSRIDSSLFVVQDPKSEELSCKEVPFVSDVSDHMGRDVADVWKPMSEDYYSEINTLYHDDEDSCYVVTGYKAQDESRICKFFAKKGWCYKGETCPKEHTYPNPNGWTTDREIVFHDSISRIILPRVQDEILLQVTHITKVNMFYAVICDEHQNYCDRVQIKRVDTIEDEDDDREETLITLNDYMNEERNVKALRRCAVMPALDQVVAARFSKDGRFYRARVVDYSDTHFCVFFVDYGNKEWVTESDVRAIEPKYLHLPFQAIECVLSNVNDTIESNEAQEFFASLVYNKTLHARVIAHLDHLPGLEILLRDEEGYDVGARIIQHGYGNTRIYGGRDHVI